MTDGEPGGGGEGKSNGKVGTRWVRQRAKQSVTRAVLTQISGSATTSGDQVQLKVPAFVRFLDIFHHNMVVTI